MSPIATVTMSIRSCSTLLGLRLWSSACGTPSGSADTKKAGLLFAGTESAMYVSFDDGDHWQSLKLDLPNTSYRDIAIKGNDLIVATYGRGLWVLDDISMLRQLTPAVASEPVHLFKPGDAVQAGERVAVIEAMKMESAVTSSVAGIVEAIHVADKGQVEPGDLVATLAAERK